MNHKRNMKLIAAGLALILILGGCSTGGNTVTTKPTEATANTQSLEPTITAEPLPTPEPHPAVTQIAAGYDCFFILCEDGSVWAWGKNQYGQLGDGTTEDRWAFVKTMEDVKKITPYFAIKNDDSLWVWGNGDFPLHRNGSTLWSWGGESPAPRQLMTDVKDANMSLILKTDGTLWAWGSERFVFGDGSGGNPDWFGSIGNPDWLTHNQNVVKFGYYKLENSIQIMDSVESIPQTEGQTFISIKTDGSMWLWGDTGLQKYPEDMSMNPFETETLMESSPSSWYWATTLIAPEKILDGVQSAVILNGGLRSAVVALKTDGSLLGWGEGFDSDGGVKTIAMGETGTINKFPEIMSISNQKVRMITGYGSEFYCVTEDGQLLWNGMASMASDVVAAAAGPAGVLALKSDGSLWMNGKFDGEPDPLAYGPERPMNLNMVSETEWNNGAVPVSYPDSFGVRSGWALKAKVITDKVRVISFNVDGVRKDLFTDDSLGYGLNSPMVNFGPSYNTVLYVKYAELIDAFSRKKICHQYIADRWPLVKPGDDFFLPGAEVLFELRGARTLSEYIEENAADQSIELPEIMTVAELEVLYYKIVPEEYKYYTLSAQPTFTPLPAPSPNPTPTATSHITSHRTDSQIPRDRDDELIGDKLLEPIVIEYEGGTFKVLFGELYYDESNVACYKDLFTGAYIFQDGGLNLNEEFMHTIVKDADPILVFATTWEEFLTHSFAFPLRDALLNLQPTDTIGYMRQIYEMMPDELWYIPPIE